MVEKRLDISIKTVIVNMSYLKPFEKSDTTDSFPYLSVLFFFSEHYIDFGKKFKHLHSHNRVISEVCNVIGRRCYKPAVLSTFCKLYPLQTMKSVRLRANLTDSLLSDERYCCCGPKSLRIY